MHRGHCSQASTRSEASCAMLVRCPSCDSTSHVTAYCRRCSKLVYVECLTLSPQSHNTDQVSIVAGGLRGRTKENTVPQTTQGQLDDEKKVADNASELEAMETQTINRIIEHIGLMREQMKDIGEHLIQRVTASVNKDLKYRLDAEKNVKKVAASIKTLCDAANQIISKMDDIEVIEPECKFPEKLTETFDTAIGLPIPDRGSALGSDFIPGILDTNMLSDTCGKVSVTTDNGSCVQVEASTGRPPQTEVVLGLRQNSTFSVPGGVSVWDGGLCVTTEDMAWVGGVGGISEVDRTGGQTTRTVTVGGSDSVCTGITRTDDGVFVASYADRKIYKLLPDGTISSFSPLTFSPLGLFPLSTNCLLVCGGSDGLYTVTDQREQHIELDFSIKDATDLAVNSDGDIAVTDYKQRQICILDCRYKRVGTYRGGKSSVSFRPRSVTCAGVNFVIADPRNHTIHVIDRGGGCLAVYQTTDDCPGKPFRVDVSPSKCLWVRFGGGTFCMYDLI